METKIDFTRINNDTNGNPRYVCHFMNLNTLEDGIYAAKQSNDGLTCLHIKYDLAVKRANKIGGRKFHNKQYGGGIVFQSYNIERTEQDIKDLLNS